VTTLPAIEREQELELLRESTRGFLGNRLSGDAVRTAIEGPRTLDRKLWRDGAEMGWIAAALPEDRGGLGGDALDVAVIAEELGRALYPGPFLGTLLAATVLAPLEGARDLVAKLAAGEMTAAWFEADTLSGETPFVVDADLADLLVISARGQTFVVPVDAPGVKLGAHAGLDLTRRFATVRLDDVHGEPLGEAGSATAATRIGALATAADALGCASRLMELTVDYALQRVAFGRVIGSYQAVKHKCADMLCWVEGSRAALRHAAVTLSQDPERSDEALSVAKSYIGEAASRLAGEALQVHGGIGFTWEHDLHLHLRRIKADEVLFGGIADHRERLASLLV
jgi:alkylation response protein AidB-like acyl-CoA dehydrogenase